MARKDFTKADGAIDRMFLQGRKDDRERTWSAVSSSISDLSLETSLGVIGNVPIGEMRMDIDNKHSNDTHVVRYTNNANNMNIENDTDNSNITNITKHTHNTDIENISNVTRVTNKSKHYDERGPRKERFGLLLDARLKDDLVHLSKIAGHRSANDLVFTVLLEYVQQPENQARLRQYRELLR